MPSVREVELDAHIRHIADIWLRTISKWDEIFMIDQISDAELDAATDAYVRERWAHVKEWREAYPNAWSETRERIRIALAAAAKVRATETSVLKATTFIAPPL